MSINNPLIEQNKEHEWLAGILQGNIANPQTEIRNYLTQTMRGQSTLGAEMEQRDRAAITTEAERNRESLLGSLLAGGMAGSGSTSAGLYQLQRATGEAMGDVGMKRRMYEEQQKQQAIQMLLGLDEQSFNKAFQYKSYITQAQLGAAQLDKQQQQIDTQNEFGWDDFANVLGQGAGIVAGKYL